MRTRRLLFLPLLLLVGAAPATQPAPRVLARAQKLLATMKDTSYQHTTDIDETTGEYNCDCSGLVGYVLKKEHLEHYRSIKYPAPFRRPRACEFHDTFAAASTTPKAGDLFVKIETLADARPGDLIAWKKDPMPEKGTTGHIVIADGRAEKVADDVWSIVVIDSTTRPHLNDTRKDDKVGGIGRGTIFIKADASGRPLAYASRSAEGPFKAFPIAIGRVIEK